MKLFKRKAEGPLTLKEEKRNIQDAMKVALAVNDMEQYHELNKNLVFVEAKIELEKRNGIS